MFDCVWPTRTAVSSVRSNTLQESITTTGWLAHIFTTCVLIYSASATPSPRAACSISNTPAMPRTLARSKTAAHAHAVDQPLTAGSGSLERTSATSPRKRRLELICMYSIPLSVHTHFPISHSPWQCQHDLPLLLTDLFFSPQQIDNAQCAPYALPHGPCPRRHSPRSISRFLQAVLCRVL